MTMLVGYLWGKRYTKVQGELLIFNKDYPSNCPNHNIVFSVAMLTTGIIMAAMADAQSKVHFPLLLSISFSTTTA